MIRCKRCKEQFMSLMAFGCHNFLIKEVGSHHKKVCPPVEALRRQSLSCYFGQWVFLAPEQVVELAEKGITV